MKAKELAGLPKENFVIACDNCGAKHRFNCAGEPGLFFTQACGNCGAVIIGKLPDAADVSTTRRLSKKVRELFAGIADVYQRIGEAMTVRGVYYRMSSAGYVDKTEKAYNQVQRALYVGRWRGIVAFDLVIDESRFAFLNQSFNGLSDAVDHVARSYRRQIWEDQKINLQIWIEKLALASILLPITKKYDVPLLPCRGYNSLSYLQQAAENIKQSKFPTVIYHFGDFDPSGIQAGEAMDDQLALLGAGNFHFERIALHEHQVINWNLPTRPTKESDPRAKNWGSAQSCELDALTPAQLRDLVQKCIDVHLDREAYEMTIKIEQMERQTLAGFKDMLPDWAA